MNPSPNKVCIVKVYPATYPNSKNRGHIVEIFDGEDTDRSFEFVHPERFEDGRKWALELAQEVVDAEWPTCYDSVDWDNLDYEVSSV